MRGGLLHSSHGAPPVPGDTAPGNSIRWKHQNPNGAETVPGELQIPR